MGRPPVDSELVRARIHRDLLDRLDAWRAEQEDNPGRPEAIRRLLKSALDQ
jgi:metal-responsive CopG/Arc/MetJ family transcriptional regulator